MKECHAPEAGFSPYCLLTRLQRRPHVVLPPVWSRGRKACICSHRGRRVFPFSAAMSQGFRGERASMPADATGNGNRFVPSLFHRHPGNPILTAADWPYAAHTVFNPGATQLASGETLLLVRVEDRR